MSSNSADTFQPFNIRFLFTKWLVSWLRELGNSGDLSMPKLNDLEGFWSSCEGIGLRLGMLSGSINTGSYNNALQVLAPAYGVQYFKMSGPQPKCEYCTRYYGRIYWQGMSMPEFPAHPNCAHTWDVWFPWEKESEFTSQLSKPNLMLQKKQRKTAL